MRTTRNTDPAVEPDPAAEDLPADPAELGQPDGKSSGPATDPAPAGDAPRGREIQVELRPSLVDQVDTALLKAILTAVTVGTTPDTSYVDAALAQQLANVRATLGHWGGDR